MEVTRPLLLGPFYLVKWPVNPNILAASVYTYNDMIFIFQEHLTYTVESLGDECLINAAKTSMSSKLIGSDSEFFSKMVVDAANAIKMSDGKGNILYLFSVKNCFSLENYN